MDKIKFRTQFTAIGEKNFSPTGEKTEMRHNPYMKEDGRRELKPDREIAIYELIQSHREECEIENIIRRAVEGDYNALNAVNGTYADITNCPSSIAEAQQYIINAKKDFDKLPKEIKAKFEYNPEIYISEMSTKTEGWLDKMGYKEAAEKANKQKEFEDTVKLNTAKAMENLATGTIINNAAGGVENE